MSAIKSYTQRAEEARDMVGSKEALFPFALAEIKDLRAHAADQAKRIAELTTERDTFKHGHRLASERCVELEAALAAARQPVEAEPVGYVFPADIEKLPEDEYTTLFYNDSTNTRTGERSVPVYLAPPPAALVDKDEVDRFGAIARAKALATSAMEFAANLCRLGTVTIKGVDYVRRDTVMNEVVAWRDEFDKAPPMDTAAIVATIKSAPVQPSDGEGR